MVDYLDYESSSFSPKMVLGRKGRGDGYMRREKFLPRGPDGDLNR